MTQPIFRRRLVEAIAVALVTTAGAVPVAAAVESQPGTPAQDSYLCSTGAKSGELALRYSPAGWTLAPLPEDTSSACSIKTTSAGLHVLFPGNSATALLDSAPSFNLASKRFFFSFAEPVLCESYYTGSSLLSMQTTDPTGDVRVLGGIQSLAYSLPVAGNANTARLTPVMEQEPTAYGPWLQCYAVPYSALGVSPADIPAPALAPSEVVLADGFEDDVAAEMRADLQIEILDGSPTEPQAFLRRNLTEIINTPFQYSIRIRNLGLAAANGVRVNEFVADAGALLTPHVTAGAWTCTARTAQELQTSPGTACGSGSGVLAVGAAGQFNLAAGASRTYTLTRNVPTGTTGQRSVLAAAVFYNPVDGVGKGDPSTSNNLASAVISLVENQAPTISCVSNPGGTPLSSPVSFQEDGAPLSFNCTLTDTDTPLTLTATSSNTTLLPNTGLLGTPSGNTWPLTLAPVADRSGTSTVTLTAKDALNAQRQLAITVNVAEVNDPPSFDINGLDNAPADGVIDQRIYEIGLRGSGGTPYLFAADGTPLSLPGTIERDANCGGIGACSLRFIDFFRFVDAGSAAEAGAGEQVDVQVASCDDPALNDYFFTDPRSNQTTPSPWSVTAGPRASGSHYDLVLTYDKGFVGSVDMLCNFRFKDTGTPSANSVDSPGPNGLTEIHFSGFAGS